MVCTLYVEYIATYYLRKTRRKWLHVSGLAVLSLVITFMCIKPFLYWSRTHQSVHKHVSSTTRVDTWRRFNYLNVTHRDNITSNVLAIPDNRYFKRRPGEVNPHNYKFLIKNEQLCDSSVPFLLIVVPSVYHHTDIRKAIRQTWASVVTSNRSKLPSIKLVFLFGTIPTIKSNHILIREQEKYGDIVQGDFLDIYFNLTIKMVAALRWVALYCSAVKFILKADEDVFINIPLLVETLLKGDNPDSIIGHFEHNAKVPRYGKWSVLEKVYPFDVYPDYMQGNTYIIPGHLAFTMFMTSKFLPYIPIEDVFITGILRKTMGIKLKHDPRFTFLRITPPSACEFVEGEVISITNVRINDFYALFDSLHLSASLCNVSWNL